MEDPLGIVGTRIDGKYLIEAAVAEGGFGRVYRARHCSLQCPVALKVLKVPNDPGATGLGEFLEAFSREARTLARLDHPALVRALDFGVSATASGERIPWMVLEWLEGTTLEEHLAAREGGGGVAPAEALALMRPAIEGIARAHALGVVHRDLKPSNLMRVEGPIGLRVLDFGIARQMEPGETEAPSGETASRSMRAFSPTYAAPEQLGGTRTGPWTDVHALALILTEVLTDRPPYDASTDDENGLDLSLAVLATERPTARRRGVDVGAWEPVLARAAALRPGDRYPDARSFLEALETALPGARHRPLEQAPALAAPAVSDRVGSRVAWIGAGVAALVLLGVVRALTWRAPAPQVETRPAVPREAPEIARALPTPGPRQVVTGPDTEAHAVPAVVGPTRAVAPRVAHRRPAEPVRAPVTASPVPPARAPAPVVEGPPTTMAPSPAPPEPAHPFARTMELAPGE